MKPRVFLSLAATLVVGLLFGCRQSTEPPAPVPPGPIAWKPSVDSLPLRAFDLVTTPQGTIVMTSDSGLYVSRDRGERWQRVRNGSARGLAIDNKGRIITSQSHTVLRSSDEGATWQTILDDNYVSGSSILALDDGTLFVDGNTVVFRSATNGTTWSRIDSLPSAYGMFNTIFARSPSTIFVAANGFGLFRSTDKGITWTHVGADSLETVVSLINGLAGEIYAVGHQDLYSTSMVWRSTDNGTTWRHVGPNAPTNPWVYQIAINRHGHLFVATATGVIRSGDNGISWEAVSDGLDDRRVFALTFDSEGYLYAGSDGGGVFRTVTSTE
jgi:photosystem II stability/assembly factor-like uncharacterized protein